jgi:acyl-CoA thioesterase-2
MSTFSPFNINLIFDQTAARVHNSQVRMRVGEELSSAIHSSLDDLLAALDLKAAGDDRFRADPPTSGTAGRVLGGQLLAQAVVGAAATVEGKDIHALHAAFVRAGTPGVPVEIAVTRMRDGRSMTTRQVAVLERGEALLVGIASFGANRAEPEVAAPRPAAAPPEEVPLLQHWAATIPAGRHWIDHPPAVEMRLAESPSFLTGATATTARSHWMRLPRSVGHGHSRNAALLAYASDFFLMDMIFRAHPDELGPGRANGFSLDHAIWFHRPVRFDDWHLYTQQADALVGECGLARGSIYDADGRLVASVAQEVLLRLGATS